MIFALFELVRAYSYIFCRGTIETMQHAEPTHTAQDSQHQSVYWVRVSARCET